MNHLDLNALLFLHLLLDERTEQIYFGYSQIYGCICMYNISMHIYMCICINIQTYTVYAYKYNVCIYSVYIYMYTYVYTVCAHTVCMHIKCIFDSTSTQRPPLHDRLCQVFTSCVFKHCRNKG